MFKELLTYSLFLSPGWFQSNVQNPKSALFSRRVWVIERMGNQTSFVQFSQHLFTASSQLTSVHDKGQSQTNSETPSFGSLPTLYLFFGILTSPWEDSMPWEYHLPFGGTAYLFRALPYCGSIIYPSGSCSILWEHFIPCEHCQCIGALSNLCEHCLTQWSSSLAVPELPWGIC